MNTETRKQTLIAESQQIQRRWYEIQQELGEIQQAEHAARHAHLHADALQHQQSLLLQIEERRQESAQRYAEQQAAWRAKHLDGVEVQRQAKEFTEIMTGVRLR